MEDHAGHAQQGESDEAEDGQRLLGHDLDTMERPEGLASARCREAGTFRGDIENREPTTCLS
ncbi:hypothetical protein GCM10009626_02090 [Brachybacterium sacelli]